MDYGNEEMLFFCDEANVLQDTREKIYLSVLEKIILIAVFYWQAMRYSVMFGKCCG